MRGNRLLLVVAFVVVIVGVVVALLLVSGGAGPAPANQPQQAEDDAPRPTAEPASTPLPTPTPIPFVELVVAVQEIPRGLEIPPNAVILRPWPEESAPFQAVGNVDDVIGRIARTDIFREQPILSNMLVEDLTGLADVGSDAAAVLPTNRVAVALPMDRITSVAYAIQPGDRVDVIISLLFVDVDPVFQSREPNTIRILATDEEEEGGGTGAPSIGAALPGRIDTVPAGRFGTLDVLISPSEQPRPRLTTQRTIQDALVIWTGDFPRDGVLFRPAATPTPIPTPDETGAGGGEEGTAPEPTPVPPRPDIITLAVSPQDAVTLTWMVEARIPMTFALRSATSTSLVGTEAVTLDYILGSFSISVPDKFSYSIEPAVRSIRQLYAGNTISLSN